MLIQLTEVTRKPEGGTVESPILFNPEGIVSVNENKLQIEKVAIIGQPNELTLRFISFTNGRGAYITASIEEIKDAVNAVPAK